MAPPGSTDRGAGLPSLWPWKQNPGGDQVDGAAGRPQPVKAVAGPLADPTAGAGPGAESATDNAAENAVPPPPLPLAELVGADAPAWFLGLEERPAEGLLLLRLAGGYGALPVGERRSLAERWLARARELGYERLELVDSAGRTLGRPARVGSGMILLDAVSTAP